MRRLGTAAICWTLLVWTAVSASAGVPRFISYQGKLNDQNGAPVNGAITFIFSLYDAATGGTPLWTEAQNLLVSNGIFSAHLGAVTPLDYVSLVTKPTLYLGIRAGADSEMSPRQELGSGALSQIQGEEIAREAVWPVHEGRNNTIRSYFYNSSIDGTAKSFQMPTDKTFIVTDVSSSSWTTTNTTLLTSCQVAYVLGGVTTLLHRNFSIDISQGTPVHLTPGRHDSFRAGLPVPAGATLQVGSGGFWPPTSYTTNSCTVAGFEIPATP